MRVWVSKCHPDAVLAIKTMLLYVSFIAGIDLNIFKQEQIWLPGFEI